MKQRKIIFYQLPNRKAPIKEWLRKLKDKRAEAKVDVRIRRAGLGNFGDFKSVGDDVLELRIQYGPGLRVYLSVVKDEIIILLLGGDKSSQTKDIEKAKGFLEDWRRQND